MIIWWRWWFLIDPPQSYNFYWINLINLLWHIHIDSLVGAGPAASWVRSVWELCPCDLSVFFVIFITLIEITLVHCVAPAVWFLLEQMQQSQEKKKKNPSCRSSFSLAAGEQIKETWRRNDSPPPTFFLSLLSSSLVADTTGAFPKKKKKKLLGSDGLFRCWNWWKGYITPGLCTEMVFSSV